MRLIDAEAFIKNLEKFLPGIHQTYLAAAVMRIVKEVIDKLPTIEAKPVVRAHWENCDDPKNVFCTKCGLVIEKEIVPLFSYCCVCGAQMDEVASDNNVVGKTENDERIREEVERIRREREGEERKYD